MEPDVGAGGAVAGGYSAGADADASPARLGARRRFGGRFGFAGEEDRKHAGGGCRAPGGCGDFCCGPDWFLGAGCPQIARRLWNTPGMAMWHSALLGSVILVLADFVSARALAPFQIPVGLVTGALGGVYMLWLLYRQR